MEGIQLSLFGDDEVISIPECTPVKITQLTVDAARKWKRSHLGKDVMEIVPPSWRTYIKAKI